MEPSTDWLESSPDDKFADADDIVEVWEEEVGGAVALKLHLHRQDTLQLTHTTQTIENIYTVRHGAYCTTIT